MYYPYLVINFEKRCKRVPEGIHISIKNCNMVLVQSEYESSRIERQHEDLLDFFFKLYSTNFGMNCFGEGTGRILEYQWLKNHLIIHNSRWSSPMTIELSMENIDAIKEISKPTLSNTSFSDWGRCNLY